jgi:hypothetical protein
MRNHQIPTVVKHVTHVTLVMVARGGRFARKQVARQRVMTGAKECVAHDAAVLTRNKNFHISP